MFNSTEIMSQLEQDKNMLIALINNINEMEKQTTTYAMSVNSESKTDTYEDISKLYKINNKIQKEVLDIYTRRSALSECLIMELV